MPRDGTGSYTRAVSKYVAATDILASEVNAEMDDIASALTASLAANGETPLTGTLNANAQAISNAGAISGASLTTTGAATVGNVLTVTKGGLLVSAGGATVTGNSTVTGTLTVSDALTVSKGGATITGTSYNIPMSLPWALGAMGEPHWAGPKAAWGGAAARVDGV